MSTSQGMSQPQPDDVNAPAEVKGVQDIQQSQGQEGQEVQEGQGQGGETGYKILPNGHKKYPKGQDPRLRYQKPYWWPYRTFVKERWIGRELLEVVSTEFRDRSVEYYRHALESGVTRVNGVVARPDFVLRNGDRLDNTVHRHEPPITNDPILVLHKDDEKGYVIISKPGSVPVHATGRYYRHTILEIMMSDYGIKCFSVNRLDRLTSGLMILALTSKSSKDLANDFLNGDVKKEYVARVKGRFPEGLIVVDEPLMTVDRQMGLVIVTPEGKDAKTMFKLMSYDEERNQSVVHCRPLTGRTHQIRVHLQYLGYPIANDPLYSHTHIWGNDLGKGGVDLVPGDSSVSSSQVIGSRLANAKKNGGGVVDLQDREYSNIDSASPIRLSQQARDVIAKLRKARDDQEDWVKWKEVVFSFSKVRDDIEAEEAKLNAVKESQTPEAPAPRTADTGASATAKSSEKQADQTATAKGDGEVPRLPTTWSKAQLPPPLPDTFHSNLKRPDHLPEGFCEECFVPVADDPDPETLFIFLHALRYTTPSLGAWATPLPRWAEVGWKGDWRGWSEQEAPPPFEDQPVVEVEVEGAGKAEGEAE